MHALDGGYKLSDAKMPPLLQRDCCKEDEEDEPVTSGAEDYSDDDSKSTHPSLPSLEEVVLVEQAASLASPTSLGTPRTKNALDRTLVDSSYEDDPSVHIYRFVDTSQENYWSSISSSSDSDDELPPLSSQFGSSPGDDDSNSG